MCRITNKSFSLSILTAVALQAFTMGVVLGNEQANFSGGSRSPDNSVDSVSRSSGMFDSSGWRSMLRIPGLPASRPNSIPGLSVLREGASNTFNQAKKSTGRWWNRTKDLFNPFDDDLGSPESQSSEPTNSTGWSWWFSPKPEERKIETVNDFLRQERPKL